jgi:predicted nucleic acid-binding protein
LERRDPPGGQERLGLPHALVLAEVAAIEGLLILLPDAPAVYPEWKRLVAAYQVTGVKVYDARLVAVMGVFGIKAILTFNTGDFARYPFITALHPSQL